MFGSEMLEIIVGLVFIYWLLSLLCSGINETISSILSMRAKVLEKAIRNLLNDPKGVGLAGSIYDHSLIRGLSKKGKKPSYISSRTFALALMKIVTPSSLSSRTVKTEEIKAQKEETLNDKVRQTLLVLAEESGPEFDKLLKNIERWFNDAMERVSGWYKRRVQTIIAILALLVSGALNADTFMITRYLINDAPMRAVINEAAVDAIKQPVSPDQEVPGGEGKIGVAPQTALDNPFEKVEYVKKELQKLPLPLGWYETPKKFEDWIIKLFGILFTAIAVSLGAPFWFDFLAIVLKIRPAQSGKKPESVSNGR